MLLAALLAACRSGDPADKGDDVDVTTDNVTIPEPDTGHTARPAPDPVTESFAWTPPPVDMLFVIDSSSSMTGRVAELAATMGPLMDAWIEREIDFHVGVVDIDDVAVQGQLIEAGGRKWVDPTMVDPGERLQQLVELVGDPSTVEAGLAASFKALNMTGPGEYNEGFLRDGSDLAVLVATDEPDQSDPGLITPQGYVTWLLGLRPEADLVGFHAFAASDDYLAVANQTDGVSWNVDNSPYGPALAAITTTLEYENAFVLSQDADEATIAVRVLEPDGDEVELDAAEVGYASGSRSVDLEDFWPPAGSTIEITYVPAPEE